MEVNFVSVPLAKFTLAATFSMQLENRRALQRVYQEAHQKNNKKSSSGYEGAACEAEHVV